MSIEEFNAFQDTLEKAMDNNEVEVVAQMFRDPKFGHKFYELYLTFAAEQSTTSFLKLLTNMKIPIVAWRPFAIALQNNRKSNALIVLEHMARPVAEPIQLLQNCVLWGHLEFINKILPLCDNAERSEAATLALVTAVRHNNPQAIKRLLPHANIPAVQNELRRLGLDNSHPQHWETLNTYEAKVQRKAIATELPSRTRKTVRKL